MLATRDLVEDNTNETTVSVFGIMVSKLGLLRAQAIIARL
jgi:hypothetical protein